MIIATSVGADRLVRCLDSSIEQDLPPQMFEVVVARYGPEDGTSSVLADAGRLHPQVQIVFVTAQGTRAAAKNAALACSRGSTLVFVNDKDRLSRGYLSGLLTRPPIDARVTVPLVLEDIDGPADLMAEPARTLIARAGKTLAGAKAAPILSTGAGIAYPRSLLERAQFDDDLDIAEDAVLLARLLSLGALTFAVPRARDDVVYRQSSAAAVANPGISVNRLLDGLERVCRLPPSPTLDPLRQRLINLATAELNLHLRARPGDHAAVIHGLQQRALTDSIDFEILNHDVARDLAVLYTAVPYVDTSANVAARRVAARGTVVDVIGNRMSKRLATDPSSDALWAEFVDRRIEVDAHLSETWWPGVTQFCRKGIAEVAKQEQIKGPYRSVYSRVMHPTSHFLAAWLTLRRPGLRWLAEFSDPVRFDVKGAERPSSGQPDPVMVADFRAGIMARGFEPPESMNLYLWLETLAYALADEITFTNRNQRAFMLDTFPDRRLAQRAAERSSVSHHPAPAPHLYRAVRSTYDLPGNVVNLAYFGVFYATRGLTEVWQALASLPAAHRPRVLLHVFTSKPDELRADLAQAGLTDIVRANGYVSYLEYLNLASQVDVLIVNDAKTAGVHGINPYLPSKLSDYSGSGTAIWGVVERGSILSAQPLDYRSELGDADGASDVLQEIIAHFESGHSGLLTHQVIVRRNSTDASRSPSGVLASTGSESRVLPGSTSPHILDPEPR